MGTRVYIRLRHGRDHAYSQGQNGKPMTSAVPHRLGDLKELSDRRTGNIGPFPRGHRSIRSFAIGVLPRGLARPGPSLAMKHCTVTWGGNNISVRRINGVLIFKKDTPHKGREPHNRKLVASPPITGRGSGSVPTTEDNLHGGYPSLYLEFVEPAAVLGYKVSQPAQRSRLGSSTRAPRKNIKTTLRTGLRSLIFNVSVS